MATFHLHLFAEILYAAVDTVTCVSALSITYIHHVTPFFYSGHESSTFTTKM